MIVEIITLILMGVGITYLKILYNKKQHKTLNAFRNWRQE